MIEPTITCPSCQSEIKLTESLAGPLIEQTRKQFAQQLTAKDRQIEQAEQALTVEKLKVEKEREGIEATVAKRLDEQRAQIALEEAARAKRAVELDVQGKDRELAELNDLLKARDEKLAKAQAQEAEFLKKQRELEEKARELDLSVQRQVNEALGGVREQAVRDAEEAAALKVKERDTQIASMQQKIEELKRKAEQGSQQLQGEAQELVIEDALRARFPLDLIEPVGKGEFGGDVLQRVVNTSGQVCGSILWESKRTKAWSDGWLTKLKGDQRAAGADLALIVSQTLPKPIETFDQVDGVWVTGSRCAMAVAGALRESLILMAGVKAAGEGQATKSALMYDYLTGPRFRHRVEAIIERFSEMQDDLNKERRATIRQWAKREQQIQAVIDTTSGLYGDLQGIAGKAMVEIDALAMPLLERGGDDA